MRLSDRRSKSVEHRRRRKVVKIQPRSKDDLDFGTFTVIGRPPNPWTSENSLKRGKSLPTMTEASASTNLDIKANIYQGHTHSIKTSSTQETSQSITVQSSSKDIQSTSFSASKSNEQQNETSSVKVNVVTAKKMELTSKTITELNVGELKRYFQEYLITIKTSQEEEHANVMRRQSDRQCIDELTRSFENLIGIIGLREDILLSQLSLPHQQQHQLQQPPQSPRRIIIQFPTDDFVSLTMGNNTNMIGVFEWSINMFQDFLNQLLPDASQDADGDILKNDDEGEDKPGFKTMIGKYVHN